MEETDNTPNGNTEFLFGAIFLMSAFIVVVKLLTRKQNQGTPKESTVATRSSKTRLPDSYAARPQSSPVEFLAILYPGLHIVAVPFVWKKTVRKIEREFCDGLRAPVNGKTISTRLDFSWDTEAWSDPEWALRKSGIAKQIEFEKSQGLTTFTVARPGNFDTSPSYLPSIRALHELGRSSGASIVSIVYLKRQFPMARAKVDPYLAIAWGERLRSITSGAGFLFEDRPLFYSLAFRCREGNAVIFPNICSLTLADSQD